LGLRAPKSSPLPAADFVMPIPEPLAYSIVIATFERPEELRTALASLAAQTRPPAQVIVVDSSPDERTRAVVADAPLPVRYERAVRPSSAVQRNQGAEFVTTPLIVFMDDDVFIPPTSLEKLCAPFEEDAEEKIGGIAGRIDGQAHRQPRGLLRFYYWLQAGYDHPTYGGKLFGAAVNCLPTYTESGGNLIPSEWLYSTCVFYRTPLFQREKFPEFEGYSFIEDVHLSARVGRTHRLYFHRTANFEHRDATSIFKRNTREMARMRVRNQRQVAHEIIGLHEPILSCKLFLHQLFSSFVVLRARRKGWSQELLGIWT
jgi:GT2 family glycosyltransferase